VSQRKKPFSISLLLPFGRRKETPGFAEVLAFILLGFAALGLIRLHLTELRERMAEVRGNVQLQQEVEERRKAEARHLFPGAYQENKRLAESPE